jgi:hypothetical protein
LMPTDWIISQEIGLSSTTRRSPTPVHPPAVPYSFIWKQSRWRFTLSSSPRRSDPRPRLCCLQNPPHSRRHQPPVRKLAAGDAQEALGELLSSLILTVHPIKI